MNLFIVIGLSLIFIVQICIFASIVAFGDRMRRIEPMIESISKWMPPQNKYSMGGEARPMTKEEKEEGIGSVEPIARKKSDVPS